MQIIPDRRAEKYGRKYVERWNPERRHWQYWNNNFLCWLADNSADFENEFRVMVYGMLWEDTWCEPEGAEDTSPVYRP